MGRRIESPREGYSGGTAAGTGRSAQFQAWHTERISLALGRAGCVDLTYPISVGLTCGGSAMHLLCPHCRNPIEVVKLNPREEITCPSCGSSFRLETESTTSWQRKDGQKLGKYELLDTVGQGAFGTVYKARDPELDRVVAVKVPRAGNLASPEG